MIEIKNVSFSYDGKKDILKNINLNINNSEIVGLLSPSGFGKSTLGKIISGYIKPDCGSVLVDGKDILDYNGFLPVQMVHQSPEKNVNIRWKVKKILNEGWQVSDEIKEKFAIENSFLEKFPTELSAGELQRICIARVLSENTKYLVADEVSSMLDSINQAQIVSILVHFAKKHGIGILFISHNRKLIEVIADRIIDLRHINKLENQDL